MKAKELVAQDAGDEDRPVVPLKRSGLADADNLEIVGVGKVLSQHGSGSVRGDGA